LLILENEKLYLDNNVSFKIGKTTIENFINQNVPLFTLDNAGTSELQPEPTLCNQPDWLPEEVPKKKEEEKECFWSPRGQAASCLIY
jgi:hypothetical protein